MASGAADGRLSMAGPSFNQDICGDPAQALQHEWLETNGLGGFGSSTITGANTRRYHGLLIAAVEPMTRYLLLSKLEETLVVADRRFEISTNLYPGAVHPEGYRYVAGFRLDPFPVWTLHAGGIVLEKRVFLVQGENTVVIDYAMVSGSECRLELRPLVAFRGYHELTDKNGAFNTALEQSDGTFSLSPYEGLPRLHFAHNARRVTANGEWYLNFEYPVEKERGLDFREDLFNPCAMEFDLGAEKSAFVIASTELHNVDEAGPMKAAEIARREAFRTTLETAASQFIVSRGSRKTIIAGYPWFADWGRDTMISLPGLTLATGRFDVARDILLEFAGRLDRGMLPNNLSESSIPEYNTVDAALWFFEAVRLYLEYSADADFVRKHLYDKLKGIIDWHIRGTRYGIHMDIDGLIVAGDASTQLTWMDARVDGKPVTPRNGKPVEIQALWYNALRFAQRLADDFKDDAAHSLYESLATRVCENLSIVFWDEKAGYLCDVIEGDRRDSSLRPNQLFTLSLGYCAIPETRARRLLSAVEGSLLTPFGLRTLAPDDPRYRGRYDGPPHERDAAYHQGTVWPWLLGAFVTADLRFNGDAARQRLPRLVAPLLQFMQSRGTGQLPEIFDGDAPHAPRGCFAQAWSVAEILRVWLTRQ